MHPYQTVEPSVNGAPNWRALLPVHPLAEAYPNLPHERLVALGEDIKNNGLQFPIVVHAKGSPGNPDVFELIDGVRRLDALVAVGIKFEFERFRFRFNSKRDHHSLRLVIHDIAYARVTAKVVYNWDDDEIAAYIESANLHRRHLEPEQYRARVEASHARIKAALEREPEKSDRVLAAELGVGKDTIRRVRATGAPAPVEGKRIGKDGKARKQPAKKAKPVEAVYSTGNLSEQIAHLFNVATTEVAPARVNASDTACEYFDAHARADVPLATNKNFEDDTLEPDENVEDPAIVLNNILDSIKQSRAVAEAYRKILKASHFDRGAKKEICDAIESLIRKWRSVQSTLSAKLTSRPASNDGAPVAGSDHQIPDDLSIPGFLNRAPTQSTRG
jgi:ParB-like chromosome segregation protein Spo0J